MTYDGTIHFRDVASFDAYNKDKWRRDHEEAHIVQGFRAWMFGAYLLEWVGAAGGEADTPGYHSRGGTIGHDLIRWEIDADAYADFKRDHGL